MRNLKKIIIASLCVIFCLFGLTACGDTEVPELTKSRIAQDLETELKAQNFHFRHHQQEDMNSFLYQLRRKDHF